MKKSSSVIAAFKNTYHNLTVHTCNRQRWTFLITFGHLYLHKVLVGVCGYTLGAVLRR